jgi:hypothetical protein
MVGCNTCIYGYWLLVDQLTSDHWLTQLKIFLMVAKIIKPNSCQKLAERRKKMVLEDN